MKLEVFPTYEELENYERVMPQIDPAAVLAMLRISQASEEIHDAVNTVLEKNYHLSEGKLRVLIVLHQHPEGLAPSMLANKTGVTRATISVMVSRMARDGQVEVAGDARDGRSKRIVLTQEGRAFMSRILPEHYLRISRIMGRLTADEQTELIRLLTKLTSKA